MIEGEVFIEHGGVTAAVIPYRGALVSRLTVDGRELLYLDEASVLDDTKSVRGGIPILFPFCGSLPDGLLIASGTRMKQHGFARDRAWTIAEQRAGYLRLTLDPDADSRAIYPWDFHLEQAITIVPGGLHIELLIKNNSDRPMPVSPGWHPYFKCPAAQKKDIQTQIAGFDNSRFHDEGEFNIGIVAPADGRSEHIVPGLGKIRITAAPDMRHLQFWSIKGRDFICIEPFTGAPNSINTEAAPLVQPGEARCYWMRIELVAD